MASDGKQYTQRICEIMEAMTDSFAVYLQPKAFLKTLSSLDCETGKKIFDEAEHSSVDAMRMLLEWLLDQDESTSAQTEFYRLLKGHKGNLPLAMLSPDGQTKQKSVSNMTKLIVSLVEGEKFENVTPDTVKQVMEILTEQKIVPKKDYQHIVTMNPLDGFMEILKLIRSYKPDWPFIVWNILEQKHPTYFKSTELNQMLVTDKEYLEIQKLVHTGTVFRIAVTITENPLNPNGSKKIDFAVADYSDDDAEDEEETDLKRLVEGVPDLNLRRYQEELAQKAEDGNNVIIFAPTGSGKTRVAVHIILKHLKQGSEENPKKVCFFARTVPLAVQQHERISKDLPDKYKTFLVTGASPYSTSLAAFIPESDVIVLTPMILVNHLKRGLLKDLSLFTLLVFDECHHTRKSEPYNELMLSYLMMKFESKLPLPQILGLTASFSTEKASSVPEAMDSVLQTCANLDANEISSVVAHKDELTETVPVPIEDIQPLEKRQDDEFVKNVCGVMKTLEGKAQTYREGINNADVRALLASGQIPCDRKSQQYNQWTVKLRMAAENHPLSSWEMHMKARMLMIIADYLRHYNIALETHELIHIEDVLSYLDTSFKHFERNKNSLTEEKEFLSAYKDLRRAMEKCRHEENPNLSMLEEVIEKHLVGKGEQSRGIVFVKTRYMAEALACWFNRCGKETIVKLKATVFTGTNASQSEGGMTQAQQEACLMNFHLGKVRLLIATSVGEEGIDVPDCNLVVKYNHVGNEISTIQTRGRSRKLGGRSILLANAEIAEREMANQQRARMMYDAVENIQHMEASRRLREIEALQKIAVIQRKEDELNEQKARRAMKNVNFRMLCKRCHQTSIASEYVKTIFEKYRVVTDWNIWKNASVNGTEVLYVDDVRKIGHVNCRAAMGENSICNGSLGALVFFRGMCFLALGITNFVFVEENEEETQSFQKWKKVKYVINEIDTPDFRRYIEDSKRNEA